jgi:GNAT superfamily N-acetyltransferase
MTISPVRTRYGAEVDLPAVTAMHERCSSSSLHRRFHAPLPCARPGLMSRLLAPDGGWSLLAEQDGRVVAMACAGPLSTCDLEVGVLVEDAHQGRGLGTRLLRETCADATLRGYRSVHCVTQADNDAVLAVVGKVGRPAVLTPGGGLVRVRIDLDLAGAPLPQPA